MTVEGNRGAPLADPPTVAEPQLLKKWPKPEDHEGAHGPTSEDSRDENSGEQDGEVAAQDKHDHLADSDPEALSGSRAEDAEYEVFDDELDDEEDDDHDDDATASDSSSNYSSISEDILPPIHAHGHVYHGSGRMVTPNDECENQRQAYQHEVLKLCLGGDLTFSKLPLDKPNSAVTAVATDDEELAAAAEDEPPRFHILDVGSGGGHWAVEMAQSSPHVEILGIELSSANLPSEVPPNLTFEIADAAEEWPPRLYDFIHLRNLVGGGIRDFRKLIVTAYEHLKPGGQLEFTEMAPQFHGIDPDPLADSSSSSCGDDTTPAAQPKPEKPRAAIGSVTAQFVEIFGDICMTQGIDFDPAPRIVPWLLEIGAENVRERSDWVPVRSWARDAVTKKKGEILNKMLIPGCEHWTLRLFALAGWEESRTRDLLGKVMAEMADPLMKSCVKATFVSGRKPLANGGEPQNHTAQW